MAQLTFYGHFTGWSSYPTVCRAIALWLWEKKVDLELCDLRAEGLYQGVEHLPRVGEEVRRGIFSRMTVVSRGGVLHAPPSADGISLCFGFPEWTQVIPRHRRKIGYHVGDVDRIPEDWVRAMNTKDLILTPSRWCRNVFIRSGVRVPIHVVQHGVGVSRTVPPRETPGPFRMRHFSSGASTERKGTWELVCAVDCEEEAPLGQCLTMIHSGDHRLFMRMQLEKWAGRGKVALCPDEAGPPEKMERLLYYTDLIVQPSRAEGFGLIPLEALASGVPVAMTACTGHAEYAKGAGLPGTVLIPTSDDMTPCGGPGLAPRLSIGDLKRTLEGALCQAQELRKEAQENAEAVRREWSWDAVLSRGHLLDLLLSDHP